MAWTDERIEVLTKLWAEGLSASQIAGRLGGVTRNAVIGKVHRLGLSGRATSSRSSAPRPRRNHAPRQNRPPSLTFGTRGDAALKPSYEAEYQQAPAPIMELVIPVEERASILTLKEAMCRWPIGDPTEEATRALLAVITESYRPNVVVALLADASGGETQIPLLEGRARQGEQATAYVCQHFTCKMPVTTPEALRELLAKDNESIMD